MTRIPLPDRRRTTRFKVRIEGHTFYLDIGHYPDGRPGDIWIDSHKTGTFARGALDSFARMASLALQSGIALERVIASLRSLAFPPNGVAVHDDTEVTVTSLMDWTAYILEKEYLNKQENTEPLDGATSQREQDGEDIVVTDDTIID